METKTCIRHFGFLDFSMKRAIITQTALHACGFVLAGAFTGIFGYYNASRWSSSEIIQ